VNGSFGDAFTANDVHIYTIDLTAVDPQLKRGAARRASMMGSR
jgi:hypothetical protein